MQGPGRGCRALGAGCGYTVAAMDRPTRLQPQDPAASAFQGLPRFARRVLDLVDAIPPGTVRSYGSIAEELGEGSARNVARVMSTYGEEVPWHRVLRVDGTCAPEVAMRQRPLLEQEGVVFVPGTFRVVAAARPARPAVRDQASSPADQRRAQASRGCSDAPRSRPSGVSS